MTLEEILLTHPRKQLKHFAKYRLNGHCIYCGYHIPDDQLTVDHIIPKKHGGSTAHWNLAPACWDCNRSKGTRDVWHWWQWSPHWEDALESGRVFQLHMILSDRRSQADFLLGVLDNNPQFRIRH